MTRALMANCLHKILCRLGDIRACAASFQDPRAAELAETMEYLVRAHERHLRTHLDLKNRRDVLSPSWNEEQDGMMFLSNAFDRLHDHLSSLRAHAASLGDPRTWELVTSLELCLLKSLRKLRLHLGIPYDSHECAQSQHHPAQLDNPDAAEADHRYVS
jgi:hypothetical protein